MVPLNPQPYDELRKRFHRCLSRVTNAAEFSPTDPNRPSNDPNNVFDTYDGYRLIVSCELMDGRKYLHASLSVWKPDARVKSEPQAYAMCLGVFKRVAGLVGETGSVAQAQSSKNGVAHLIFPLDQEIMERNNHGEANV